MKNFWRGFRQAKDIREREERARVKSELLDKLRELLTTGGSRSRSGICAGRKRVEARNNEGGTGGTNQAVSRGRE